MNEYQLTIEDMQAKIERVKQDLLTLQSEGTTSRKSEVLNEYLEYLEDELSLMKRELRDKQKT
jgi:cob(I)alamin adenosyltransferase